MNSELGTFQLSEIKAPIPADIRPGDLVQWARWYMMHRINGGRDIGETEFCYIGMPRCFEDKEPPKAWLASVLERRV